MPPDLPSDDTIVIVDYNPDWIKLAHEEIAKLKKLFKGQDWLIDIQHNRRAQQRLLASAHPLSRLSAHSS